jgi:hydroxypyruvate reductase
MIIRNFQLLSTNSAKKDALNILEAGLDAANPSLYLKQILKNDHLIISGKKINFKKYKRVLIVAVGKASYIMAKTVDSLTSIAGGLVITPNKVKMAQKKFQIVVAGHPIPNKNSLIAAKMIIQLLDHTTSNDLVIFLISGGSSSLVAMPDGITLAEKQKTTDLLLKCGASIQEINCIRKHLSKIKGGKLLEHLRSDAVSLVMSDVVGDDLSSIASGMTYCDLTLFSDAKKILQKYSLDKLVPQSVILHLDCGIQGKIPETPKKPKISNYIIASNNDCLDAMKSCAQDLGYFVKTVKNISSNVEDLGISLSKMVSGKKRCVIFGGESTVAVKGKGKGGRNQELVLRISSDLSLQNRNAIIASVGTDGIDGNTRCAGAMWQSDKTMNDASKYLSRNDSHGFFKKYGGLVFTGYTGTNLLDIGLVLYK